MTINRRVRKGLQNRLCPSSNRLIHSDGARDRCDATQPPAGGIGGRLVDGQLD